MTIAETFLWPDEIASEMGCHGWVSRSAVPNPEEAIALVARETGVAAAELQAQAVRMREESEVEARINGHEFPLWVECTRRARVWEPYWRVSCGAAE